MSAIEAAPATMPAISALTFAPAATPAPPATLTCRSASSPRPGLGLAAVDGFRLWWAARSQR